MKPAVNSLGMLLIARPCPPGPRCFLSSSVTAIARSLTISEASPEQRGDHCGDDGHLNSVETNITVTTGIVATNKRRQSTNIAATRGTK